VSEGKSKMIIGRSSKVRFPDLGFSGVPARVDTGATASAIWAESAVEKESGLSVVFFGKKSPFYTGEEHHFKTFGQTEVRSSNGQAQVRYTIRVLIVIAGRKVWTTFSLADRSAQLYPVLIGRNLLRGKFIVDVARGMILPEEKERAESVKTKYRQI
jgi:hypothetical protein